MKLKVKLFYINIFILAPVLSAQQSNPLDYYPAHAGDVWQYHSSFTNKLVYTYFIDSVFVDSTTKDLTLFERFESGNTTYTRAKIDSSGNYYNRKIYSPHSEQNGNYTSAFSNLADSDSGYIRYKLYAETGDSWISGYQNDSIPVIVSVEWEYESVIFGTPTHVKVYKFAIEYPPPQGSFTIGYDYLALNLGLIQSDIEPSDIYVLTGANIDSVEYGNILGISNIEYKNNNYNLMFNYPNPFNPNTIIKYHLPDEAHVILTVYDILGSKVAALTDEIQEQGNHEVIFDGSGLSGGVYIYTLNVHSRTINFTSSKKMVLLK